MFLHHEQIIPTSQPTTQLGYLLAIPSAEVEGREEEMEQKGMEHVVSRYLLLLSLVSSTCMFSVRGSVYLIITLTY